MSRPTLAFCNRGHEVAVLGRHPSGDCRACASDRNREYVRPRPDGYEFSRIVAVAGGRDAAIAAWAHYRGCSWGTAYQTYWRRVRQERVPLDVADQWSIAIGLHLALVFPQVYSEAYSA